MAEQQQSNALATALPSPPPFYQHFTPENLERIAALRSLQEPESANASFDTQNTPEKAPPANPLRILDLPPELRYLQPPDPPAEGVYKCFGDVFNLNEGLPSLAEQGIEQLYTPPETPSPSSSSLHSDRALVLKRLAKSLLLNFLELMGIMSVNPEQSEEKIQDIRTLFINFHHLLNEYRPHQARESLIMMMEDQLERSRNETAGIERMKAKVEDVLSGLGQAKLANGDASGEEMHGLDNGTGDEVEVVIWEELSREFG